MNSENAKDILIRYRFGNCTVAEQKLLENWILYGKTDPLDLNDDQLLGDLLEIRLRLERDLLAEKAKNTHRLVKWVRYAAAIVFILSAGFWLFNNQRVGHEQPSTTNQIADIAPGGNKATLTLADGKRINLSEGQSGIVVGDEITYTDGSTLLDGERSFSQTQRLTTPKGGTYQIILPDGTKVWLNSASTLIYPVSFDNDERIVELAGEAYFEVARNHKKPFKVTSKGQQLTVLGTSFNISAYSDETEIKTTLVEGSVYIAPTAHHQSAILIPGQQSTVSDESVTIDEVDITTFTSWKDGFFIFKGTDLREAMKQIGRWYDVEVVYEGNIAKTPFFGKISRDDTLVEVLEILKEGNVNFRIERQADSNRLVVMP